MGQRVAVAVSGGRDSTALLHCTLRAAAPLGVEVFALHVHHGLVAEADEWLAQVRRQSQRWGAAFDHRRLEGAPSAGDSIEAWARRERYCALGDMAAAEGCSLVLLAHHRRDQAETWLLQALRGGGPAGLAAMPRQMERAGVTWARPWLDMPRQAIEAYVRRHRLRHVDDSSNADPRFARNRLRLHVWPALMQAFPDAESALSTATRQAHQAALLASEVAALDLPLLQQGAALQVAAWLALPPARRRNALRAWLAVPLGGAVPGSLLDRLMAELPGCRSARWPVAGLELWLYRGLLGMQAPTVPPAGSRPHQAIDLGRPGETRLAAWCGRIAVTAVNQGGVPAPLLQAVLPRARQGGERFRLSPHGLPRSLKKQFQTLAVPAWARAGPLLFTPQGQLVFVPGLGMDAGAWAAPGEPQLAVTWTADPPGTARTRRHDG